MVIFLCIDTRAIYASYCSYRTLSYTHICTHAYIKICIGTEAERHHVLLLQEGTIKSLSTHPCSVDKAESGNILSRLHDCELWSV